MYITCMCECTPIPWRQRVTLNDLNGNKAIFLNSKRSLDPDLERSLDIVREPKLLWIINRTMEPHRITYSMNQLYTLRKRSRLPLPGDVKQVAKECGIFLARGCRGGSRRIRREIRQLGVRITSRNDPSPLTTDATRSNLVNIHTSSKKKSKQHENLISLECL